MIAAIFVGLGFILAGFKPIGKGLILGTIFSIINFVLMGLSLPGRMVASKQKVIFRSLMSIGFRYAILAIPLFLAIHLDSLNFPAVVCGIFMIQIIIVFESLLKHLIPSLRDRI